MNEERSRILSLLASGKISVQEAEELIDALGEKNSRLIPEQKKDVRFFIVQVRNPNKDNVDVRVPLNLVRAGMKLTSLIPPHAMDKINESMKQQGISFDLSNFKQSDIEELIQSLAEMQVDVQSQNGDTVKVFCQ